jgi:hypothetical protein
MKLEDATNIPDGTMLLRLPSRQGRNVRKMSYLFLYNS